MREILRSFQRIQKFAYFKRSKYLFSTAASEKPKLLIVFGSQSGTAEAFANDLEFDSKDSKIETEIIDAQNFSIGDLSTASTNNSVVAFIMATYGEGDPTDNARKFIEELNSDVKSNISCNYSVFGLGNSQCFKDRYNVVGKALDQRLTSLGCKRLLPIGLGDASANNSASFAIWKKEFLNELNKVKVNEGTSVKIDTHKVSSKPKTASVLDSGALDSSVNRDNLENKNPSNSKESDLFLSKETSILLSIRQQAMTPIHRPILISKVKDIEQLFHYTNEIDSTVHISFDLTKSNCFPLNPACDGIVGEVLTKGLLAGDHVGVFAPNSQYVINRFMAVTGLPYSKIDDRIEGLTSDPTATLKQILTWQIQLTSIVPITSLKILHRWTNENEMTLTTLHLQTLIDDYDRLVVMKKYDISSILEMIPISSTRYPSIPLVPLLKSLPTISPRLYSLTRDPITNRNQASLLCRLLRYRDTHSNRIISGLCSSYLTERLKVGDQIAIFFRESSFHLPDDPTVPVIMIAGGSGIAPFLSFVQERQRKLHKNMNKILTDELTPGLGYGILYYGCRYPDEYMMREELVQQLNSQNGGLSKLIVAFSSLSKFNKPSKPNQKETINSTTVSIPSQMNLSSIHTNEIIIQESKNITDVVRTDSHNFIHLLRKGAYVYVCGGQGNFGNAVREVINQLSEDAYKDQINDTENNQQHKGLRYLVQQKRYFEDLAD